MANVVAVTEIGKGEALHLAKAFAKGEDIAECLDRVPLGGQGVVDRYGRALLGSRSQSVRLSG